MGKKQKGSNNKNGAKKYKVFELNSKEAYARYLNFLIRGVYINLNKYKRYLQELREFIYSYGEFEGDELVRIKKIPYEEFEKIDDMIHNVAMNLIKDIGDSSGSSCSYFKFRTLIEKNKLKIEVVELSEEVKEALKDVNILRNWMFHNPESLINADIEIYKASFPKELRDYIKVGLNANPIHSYTYEYVSKEFAISLLMHTEKRSVLFDKVYKAMVKDYEILIGEKLIIKEERVPVRELKGHDAQVVQLSMAIQKSQYKGDEAQLENAISIVK